MTYNPFSENVINKTLMIIFLIYSAFLLSYSSFFVDPCMFGDGHEYLGMTTSFYNHLTPDLREEDIALRNCVVRKNGINFPAEFDYRGYFESLSGAYYSYHFWVYSLLNLPAFSILHYLDLNELRCFQITNSLLLISCLLIIIYFAPSHNLQKLWLFLFFAFSPALFYIRWPHPELFSYSFVVMAIAFALRKNYKLSVLTSSIASLQNPPIVILTFYLIFTGWKEAKWNFKDLSYLLATSAISIMPFLFYYWNYHVLSLIASLGASSISYISLSKISSLFVDLNFGMLAYIPLLLVFSLYTLITSIKKKNLIIPSLWIVLILMALLCSTAGNWNCGMNYIHRYAVWMVPIIILMVVHDMTNHSSKKMTMFLLIAFVVTASITGHLLYKYDDSNYVRLNGLSTAVLVCVPSFYNPPVDVFAERTLGEECNYYEYLPIAYTYDGQPRKILTDYGYVNFETKLYKLPIDENKVRIYAKYNDDITIMGEKVLFSLSNNGWHSLEDWGDTPTRWMSDDATLMIYSDENRTADLSLHALSFYHPRTLEIYVNDLPQIWAEVPTEGFVMVNVPISLNEGANFVRFHVPEGCERPCDTPELKDRDSRCLSMAVQDIKIKRGYPDQ